MPGLGSRIVRGGLAAAGIAVGWVALSRIHAAMGGDRPADNFIHQVRNDRLLWLLGQPLLWAAVGIVLGPYLFFRGFLLLRRKRLILNIPRSTVRGVALGAVEISGQAVGPYTLVSPLTQSDCYYYRVSAGVNGSDRKRACTLVDEMCAPMFVDDGTGRILTDPRGAELRLPEVAAADTQSDYMRHLLRRHGYDMRDLMWARECSIQAGDRLFVLGTVQENPWAEEKGKGAATALSRVGPNLVSEAEAALQSSEGLHPQTAARPPSNAEFDLYPLIMLREGRTPFVISTQSQRTIVAQLNWSSVLYIWGGPVITLASLWEILQRLSAWRVLTN